jgi:hypothetical protein
MTTLMNRIAVAAALFGVLAPMAPATAQVEDLLKHGHGSGAASGDLGKLGGVGSALSGGSLASGSTGNVAGLLEFCMKNNFLSGHDPLAVKDKLMGKLGGTPAPDSGYAEGTQGVLKTGSGGQLDLSSSGLKEQATRQICDKVLAQAKSML